MHASICMYMFDGGIIILFKNFQKNLLKSVGGHESDRTLDIHKNTFYISCFQD